MQHKFLQDLALDKEVIDKILAENKADLDGASTATQAQLDQLTAQLITAKDTLKSFEDIDVKELQGKIIQLNTDLAAKEAEYQTKLADMEFGSQLDGAIAASGARNAKTIKALLDLDALKSSKNQGEDIKKALEAVKTENDYLFGKPSEKPAGFKGFTPVDSGDKPTKVDTSKMSYEELAAFMSQNPDADI